MPWLRNALWTSEVVITEGGQGPPPWRKDRITQTSSHIEPSGFSKAEGERPLFGKPSQWKMQLSGNKISSSWTAPICALAMPEEIHISNDFVFLETLFFQSSLATGDVEALHQLLLLLLGCHHNTTTPHGFAWFHPRNVLLLGNQILFEMKPHIYYETTNPNHSIWSQTTTLHVSVIANAFKLAGGIDLESKKILQIPPNTYLLSQSWIIFGFR